MLSLITTLILGVTAFVNVTSGTGTASSSTIAATAASHTTGNLLVVAVGTGSNSSTVSSITDTAGNSYVSDATCKVDFSTTIHTEIWWAKNITGNASNVVTANLSAANTSRRIIVAQYSGADTVSPWETCVTTTATAATSITSPSFSPANTGNANIAAIMSDTNLGTITAGTNYTKENEGITAGQRVLEDRVNAPSGSQTAALTWVTSGNAGMAVGTFKAPATCINQTSMGFFGCF